jgi:peroxiredoxin
MIKKLATLILSVLLLTACGESGYVINGKIDGQKDGSVYLKIFRNKMFFDVDTATIGPDGSFTFKGKVGQPLVYALATDEMSDPQPFFLENATMDVTFGSDGSDFKVLHSPINDLFFANFEKASSDENYNIDSLVTKYPTSPVSAFLLYRYFTYSLSLDQLKATRAKLSEDLAACPYVKDLDAIIARLEKVQVGATAPDFSLPDTTGTTVSLSSFKGKYVLLDFWASWCPYCRKENPNVVKAFNMFKDKNFTVVGISLDKEKKYWMEAIQHDSLTWTQLSDLKYWDSQIAELYGVRGIPANVLINPQGVILARNVMGEDLIDALSKELNKDK